MPQHSESGWGLSCQNDADGSGKRNSMAALHRPCHAWKRSIDRRRSDLLAALENCVLGCASITPTTTRNARVDALHLSTRRNSNESERILNHAHTLLLIASCIILRWPQGHSLPLVQIRRDSLAHPESSERATRTLLDPAGAIVMATLVSFASGDAELVSPGSERMDECPCSVEAFVHDSSWPPIEAAERSAGRYRPTVAGFDEVYHRRPTPPPFFSLERNREP